MRATISPTMEVEASAAKLATTVSARPREHHRAPAEAVGQCAEHELRYRHAEQEQRERELHGAGAGAERGHEPGIAGARMLSESGPTAVQPISSASRR